MKYTSAVLAGVVALVAAQETVLGVYVFSRHGDRTAKSTPPANLTSLGYQEVLQSGTYFRDRYVVSSASRRIYGINADFVKQSQMTASAPTDTVLQNSAMAFLQGVYPPVGQQRSTSTLRNGTVVQTPFNGYQLIPLQTIQTGAGSEDSAWLQGTTSCYNAQLSSDSYYRSAQYMETLRRTQPLYDSIYPMVNQTFTQAQTSFRNGYVLWDLLNVASIHDASAPLPSAADMTELKYLADQHEWGLAYNNSEPIRAISGSVLAAEIVSALNTTLVGRGKSKLNIQFGAYATMMSFFGLANLTSVNADFYGLADYASTLTWELVTNASVSGTSWPSNDQISVRFLFHNGTASNSSPPTEYPLFNSNRSPLPWNDFVSGMNKFSIRGQAAWCQACGNVTGVCSSGYLQHDGNNLDPSTSSSNKTRSGLSSTVAGVIGAMVTLTVVLLLQGLILLAGGFKLVNKKRVATAPAHTETEVVKA